MNYLAIEEVRLGVALAVGMLIGAEREYKQAGKDSETFAGLRTFALVSLLGGLFVYLGPPALLVVGAFVVGLTSVAAYVMQSRKVERGATTEFALVVTYGLGALALRDPVLAASLSVIVALLLAAREPLHKLLRETLTESELRDALVFLLFALVVLPIAPDRRMGPYQAIHPQSLVRLIVLLMAITGAGYVAQRLLGNRFGLALTGLVGGFVSSSATTGAMSLLARRSPGRTRAAVSGALASNVATIVLYAVIVASIDVALLQRLAAPLALAGSTALLLALAFTRQNGSQPEASAQQGQAFQLLGALGLVALVGVVSIASAALKDSIGRVGIVVVSAVVALLDAHATAGSVASLHRGGSIDADTGALAILAALSTNSLTKIAFAWSGRRASFGVPVTLSVALVAGAAWVGLWLL